jgi:8-oxo-dGTP diphosphatase
MVPNFNRISAGFLVKDRKVLVAQRNENAPQPLKWEFPGGKLNEEEQYDEALVREFKEEFDMKIEVLKEIGGAEVQIKDKMFIVLFFLINGNINELKLKYHKEYKFLTINELKGIDLSEADKSFINKYEDELKEYID